MGKLLRYVFFILLLSIVITSCQKEQSVKEIQAPVPVDNSNLLAMVSSPGNFLANAGTLTITVDDSTYVFDAKKDSIAFVNLYLDDKKYFGITAINKEHTMSFGISSSGYAVANVNTKVAGSQFLLSKANNSNLQYALTQYPELQDMSKISLTTYAQDSVLAKGTFVAFLSKDTKLNSAFYQVKGVFDLKTK